MKRYLRGTMPAACPSCNEFGQYTTEWGNGVLRSYCAICWAEVPTSMEEADTPDGPWTDVPAAPAEGE